MIIERVQVQDTKALLEIYAPYVKNTAISFEYEVPSEEEFSKRIQEISNKYPYIKAVENGEIIGYAYANYFKTRKAYDRAVETTIYVREDCKHKGVGKALYEALENSLNKMGIINMNACIASPATDSPYLNDDSRLFHQKMGFELVGRFHKCGYKFNEWFDMIWMEKIIADHVESPSEVLFGNWEL